MRHSLITAALLQLIMVCPLLAADHPVEADRLRLLDRSSSSGKRYLYFRAVKESGLTFPTASDPTVSGATVEVFGSGGGDGNSGTLVLPAENWKGLGTPAGRIGYYYRDHDAVNGISQVYLTQGRQGGSLMISARGSAWTYQITQPQTDVMVRMVIGSERYCARFTQMDVNRAEIVFAKNNPAIANCD